MSKKRNEETYEEPVADEIDEAPVVDDSVGDAAPAEAGGRPRGPAGVVAGEALSSLSREELENELELARAEIERLQDQTMRRQADLVNYRRRAQREIAESTAVGQSKVLELLVPVIDDFERAVDVEAEDARAYHEGMQLILRTMQKVLAQMGVERIEPRGEPFDPRLHEAIARHETDEAPAGEVIDVYQTGYRLGDRLIRPAAVVVAFGGDDAGTGQEDGATVEGGDSTDG